MDGRVHGYMQDWLVGGGSVKPNQSGWLGGWGVGKMDRGMGGWMDG